MSNDSGESILYRCPKTGADIQRGLESHGAGRPRQGYAAILCTDCNQLHFVDRATGKLLGQSRN